MNKFTIGDTIISPYTKTLYTVVEVRVNEQCYLLRDQKNQSLPYSWQWVDKCFTLQEKPESHDGSVVSIVGTNNLVYYMKKSAFTGYASDNGDFVVLFFNGIEIRVYGCEFDRIKGELL